MLTFKKVNKALAEAGYKEQLVQGKGYLYFIDGDAWSWVSQSIPVAKLNHLRNIPNVLYHRNVLATDPRNSTITGRG